MLWSLSARTSSPRSYTFVLLDFVAIAESADRSRYLFFVFFFVRGGVSAFSSLSRTFAHHRPRGWRFWSIFLRVTSINYIRSEIVTGKSASHRRQQTHCHWTTRFVTECSHNLSVAILVTQIHRLEMISWAFEDNRGLGGSHKTLKKWPKNIKKSRFEISNFLIQTFSHSVGRQANGYARPNMKTDRPNARCS